MAGTYERLEELIAAREPVGGDGGGATRVAAMQSWSSVTWPQRGLVIGVITSALVVVTGAVPSRRR